MSVPTDIVRQLFDAEADRPLRDYLEVHHANGWWNVELRRLEGLIVCICDEATAPFAAAFVAGFVAGRKL